MNIQLTDGITLLSGVTFNYNDPGACDLKIDDIATALSNICRFSGHLPFFYSVAQHAVNTSYIVPPEHALTALCHDTAEAFTNDLPTPLKVAVPVFKDLEVKIESAMGSRFGFTYPLPDAVKKADLQMLLAEKTYVKGDKNDWAILNGVEMPDLTLIDLSSMPPPLAKKKFMERFECLSA